MLFILHPWSKADGLYNEMSSILDISMTHPSHRSSAHAAATLQALLVTFLWSVSFVVVKWGLQDIPALTFAGICYSLAFICLVCVIIFTRQTGRLRTLSLRQWGMLGLLGIFNYSIMQGTLYFGLASLPAITVQLLFNFSTLIVALFGMVWLAEKPNKLQWLSIALCILAGVVFFYPAEFPRSQVIVLLVVITGVFSNALAAVSGQYRFCFHALEPYPSYTASH